MFVEAVRLLIVAFATAGGYVVAREEVSATSAAPAAGATIGALVGYVAGGVFGRLIRRATVSLEHEAMKAPPAQLLAGAVGATLGGVLGSLLALPAAVLAPRPWGWGAFLLAAWVAAYEGGRIAAAKSAELLRLAGLEARSSASPGRVLLDTSAIIDGRLVAVADAGFLPGPVLVARFVLDELQAIADTADPERRRRGRRGLESLDVLRHRHGVGVRVVDDEVPELEAVDAKLVALARRLGAALATTDENLQHVAELQGVRCLNVRRLAGALRPPVGPGDVVTLSISREGKEPGQGVGFLEDGTMVVVGGAADLVGRDVPVRVTSNVRTSVGRLLFASID